jgi:surface polysaccharide O-acyltransferase-like enzyme
MTEVFLYALAISTVFFLFKFVEMKFASDDEKKPLKAVTKESLIVYIASVVGIYLYSQFDIESVKAGGGKTTMAFVDNPAF